MVDNNDYHTNDTRDFFFDQRHNNTGIWSQAYNGGWLQMQSASQFDAYNRRILRTLYNPFTGTYASWYFYFDPYDRLTMVRYTPITSVPTTYQVFELLWLGDRLTAYWQTDYPSATTSKRYVGTDETNRPIDMMSWPTSGDATRVWSINPSAWGFDTNAVGPSVYQPVLFAGQYRDEYTEAYENDGVTVHRPSVALNGFRTYDPFTGTYMQVDPWVAKTWSTYLYADGNPVANIDPSGRGFVVTNTGVWYCPDSQKGGGGSVWLPGVGEVIIVQEKKCDLKVNWGDSGGGPGEEPPGPSFPPVPGGAPQDPRLGTDYSKCLTQPGPNFQPDHDECIECINSVLKNRVEIICGEYDGAAAWACAQNEITIAAAHMWACPPDPDWDLGPLLAASKQHLGAAATVPTTAPRPEAQTRSANTWPDN